MILYQGVYSFGTVGESFADDGLAMKITLCLALAAIAALSLPTGSVGAEVAMKDGVKDPPTPRGADQPVGWRGNWTGKFPDANPPITWSKLSKQMKGLRCQAE